MTESRLLRAIDQGVRVLGKRQRAAWEQASSDGFVTLPRCDIKVTALWEKRCEANNAAFVQVYNRRKYAHVSMDMIFSDRGLSAEGESAVAKLFAPYIVAGGIGSSGKRYCLCTRVPMADAPEVARALAEISVKYPGDKWPPAMIF